MYRTLYLAIGILALAKMLGAQDCELARVTHGLQGQLSNGDCEGVALSRDARFVAYASAASNLVMGDTNSAPDCFVTDRVAGTTEMVSVSSQGVQGNAWSYDVDITPDGRFVTFRSRATNLDPRDTDSVMDVYVHDRRTRTTTLASVRLGSGGTQFGCTSSSISDDGRFVLFDCSDANVLPGVLVYNAFVRDTLLDTTELVSIGPAGEVEGGASDWATMSGDGRYVVFGNTKVVWAQAGLGAVHALWIRDRVLGATRPVSVSVDGSLANGVFYEPQLSSSGNHLVFITTSSNLLPPSEPHGVYDVVRWDRRTNEFKAVSKSPLGLGLDNQSSNPSISSDGSRAVFFTYSSNATTYLAPYSNLVLVDLETDTSRLVNVNDAGKVSDTTSYLPTISSDGTVVGFSSYASNLVSLPSNGATEIYVRACDVASPMVYCTPVTGPTGCAMRIGSTGVPSASAGAGFVLRTSGLPNQAPTLFLYGTTGSWGAPLFGAWLCVQPPLSRAPGGSTAGSGACDGAWRMDFNTFIAGGSDAALVAGSPVYVQAWSRNSTGAGQLSDALAFVIEP